MSKYYCPRCFGFHEEGADYCQPVVNRSCPNTDTELQEIYQAGWIAGTIPHQFSAFIGLI
jgi:hypothetical protein